MQSPCSRKELSQKNRKDVGVTEAECASCMQCVEAGGGRCGSQPVSDGL